MNNNYISVILGDRHNQGKLGNILFELSHAYCQSIEHNRPFILFNDDPAYFNRYIPNILRKFDFIPSDIPVKEFVQVNVPNWYRKTYPDERNTLFYGYCFSEKYFQSYTNVIRDLYSPVDGFAGQVYTKYPILKTTKVTAIQVRHGHDVVSFCHRAPPLSIDYIHKVAESVKSEHYFIITDNIEWCSKNLHIPNSTIIDEPDWVSMWIMSLCHNFIISNSTFGWWGAYLSKNRDKIVYAPEVFYGPEILNDYSANHHPMILSDLYPPEWKIVASQYKDGEIVLRTSSTPLTPDNTSPVTK